ncbi:MAG: hypothetical protein A4E57_02179 [Syntrophorhabdaceae bacterium PtaU1.Bin034]|nr:MAG: hypothetical protein A4E57_02179 [Syntrophorhabdaceae bacterium PtaU1.Bin034]
MERLTVSGVAYGLCHLNNDIFISKRHTTNQ